MKVCRISRRPLENVTSRFPGGRFSNLSAQLRSGGHEVVELEIQPRLSANPYIGYTLGILTLPCELRKIRPHLLIADTPEAGMAALFLKFLFRLPVVFDFIDDYSLIASYDGKKLRHRAIQWLERKLPSCADQVVVVTREMEQFCLDNGVSRDRLHHVTNGVDTKVFFPMTAPGSGAFSSSVDGEKVVLYRGKMDGYYRVDRLLRAVPAVLDEIPATRFLMVGDGKELAALKELSVKLGIQKAVRFTGMVPQDQLNRYISSADVCVYPLPNSTGLAVMEYAACAKPVVLTSGGTAKIGNSHELITSNLVRLADDSVDGLATAIFDLLANPRAAQAMGEAAHKLVVNRYDWTRIAVQYEAVLLKAVQGRG
jgi:glycosyltransferase involved in cell wall biosynthesis